MNICDAHNDFPTKLSGEEFLNYLNSCENYGVKIIVASIFTTELHNPLCTMQDIIHNILSYNGKLKVLCHIEDLGFLKSENDLDIIIDLKPFSCGLVWNYENCIATKNGLTRFGKLVVKRLVENNIVVDLAHANKKTFYDVSKIVKKHLFVSHTGFYEVCESSRNINKKQIKTIVKSGGFIGLFLVKNFIGSNSLEKHLEFAEKNKANKHVGIGTDFYGTTNLLDEHDDYDKLTLKISEPYISQNFLNYLRRLERWQKTF